MCFSTWDLLTLIVWWRRRKNNRKHSHPCSVVLFFLLWQETWQRQLKEGEVYFGSRWRVLHQGREVWCQEKQVAVMSLEAEGVNAGVQLPVSCLFSPGALPNKQCCFPLEWVILPQLAQSRKLLTNMVDFFSKLSLGHDPSWQSDYAKQGHSHFICLSSVN